jgi:NADPH:quinone reductase-like Zn-dependent oxidoreductase
MLADAQVIAHRPKSLSMREAAALPLAGIAAYEGLKKAGADTSKKVLVHGGAGGVGHVAVQLARDFGADVYATGTGEKQRGVIGKFSATAIDFRAETVAE